MGSSTSITIDGRLLDELENAGRLAEEVRKTLVATGFIHTAAKVEQICETLSTVLVIR